MKFTQLVNFEVGWGCRFESDHKGFCPAIKMKRTNAILDDELIVQTAAALYQQHGFTGMIGFHYYCEPWSHTRRMFDLLFRIAEKVGKKTARFLLWTNLTMHIRAVPEHEQLKYFEQVHVTSYDLLDPVDEVAALRNVAANNPNVTIHTQKDDRRARYSRPAPGACLLPFLELSFDVGGRLHPCCYDWAGELYLGQLGKEPLEWIVENWKAFRHMLCASPHGYSVMGADAPLTCKLCGHRNPNICSIDPMIAQETARALSVGDVF